MTKKELRKKWDAIERGEIPDDYQNPFLSHFGFMDYPLDSNEELTRKRAREKNNS
jgi:hypothetical protein